MRKNFFRIPPDQARPCLLLSLILVAGIGTSVILSLIPEKETKTSQADMKLIDEFLSTIHQNDSLWKSRYSKTFKDRYGKTIRLVPFDPNTVDSATLVGMGLRPYIAKNILRYRSKGGKFRTPESFSKIYGISPEQFRQLQPFIFIGEEFLPKKYDTLRFDKSRRDSLKPFKYTEGAVVELNSADTTELKKIPQIGSGLAKMIVGYREKLGGFYSTGQLAEIEYMPANMAKWFVIKSPVYRRIHINKYTIAQMRNHPYMNFYQAKAIMEHRRRFGKIKSLSDISLYTEFTRKDLERLSPYIDFD